MNPQTFKHPCGLGTCCSKTSVRFQFSEQRENLLTARCGISFCFERAQDKEPQVYLCAIMTSCPMDSWQSSQPVLCCFARACSLSHLANPSRRDRTCHRRNGRREPRTLSHGNGLPFTSGRA